MTSAADLVVVGGGPAGLATAIQARLAGLSVVVCERSQPSRDKACGEGLMPDAVARLRELGVALPAGSGFPLRGIRYLDGAVVAEGVFPRGGGLGVRRTALHAALAGRAAELGADLRWGTVVNGLIEGGVATGAGPIAARWIVGADGLLSRVRTWAGLAERGRRARRAAPARAVSAGAGRFAGGGGRRSGGLGDAWERRRFGVRRHYSVAPWSDFVEVHWGPGCEAYVTPVAAREVGIAILWSGGPACLDELLAHFPSLTARLAGAPRSSRDRGAGPLQQKVRRVCRRNLALVGDAAGYLDAITGEGLAVALHQSAALVAALAVDDLSRYAAAHRRIGRLPGLVTSLVLALERHPAWRRRAMSALASEPAVFSKLLGILGRSFPARRLGASGALRLAWRLATV